VCVYVLYVYVYVCVCMCVCVCVCVSSGPMVQMIAAHYEENPDSFNDEIRQLDQLREVSPAGNHNQPSASSLRGSDFSVVQFL